MVTGSTLRLSVGPGEAAFHTGVPPPTPFLQPLDSLSLSLSRANFWLPFQALGPRVSLRLEAWALRRLGVHSTASPRQGARSPLMHHVPENNLLPTAVR